MPYQNVTDYWLRDKIAELSKQARLYMTSAEYEVYFARMTATVNEMVSITISLREDINNAMEFLNALEERQDDV